jgi:hypothetical protein
MASFRRNPKAWPIFRIKQRKNLYFGISCAVVLWLIRQPHYRLEDISTSTALFTSTCGVKLASECGQSRSSAAEKFANIYRYKKWGSSPHSHTLSGSGSTIQGAFETIINLGPKLRELNITAIADVPSGDCGWQFALPEINAAEIYFGGDITPHVAENNAFQYRNHYNKVFAHWDVVTCPIPHWYTTCDPTIRPFDLVIMRDVIQHMLRNNSMKAIKSVVVDSGAKYLAVTSFSSLPCEGESSNAMTSDGGFVKYNLHCPPWNLPEPFFQFQSHVHFPAEEDSMELYLMADLVSVVSTWPHASLTRQ